jgi:cysteinyl-tRNA synthetase
MHFEELSRKYENDFFKDMESLKVEYPDILVRVSEHVPEIITYIESLINKGFAYELNGSVYFDTEKYKSSGFVYGKLMAEQSNNDKELLEEGEGKLFSVQDDKKSNSDFVLWKKTKDKNTEPFWKSPWGEGRPGWHIECSVMSQFAFKNISDGHLDVHAGGVDLKFPHHENEEAQSCAHLGCQKWSKYWLHTGHLNIRGLKMSKSLKNFVTIKEVLKKYTARQIRLCFILHKYNATMDYDDNTMVHSVNIEKIFVECFRSMKVIFRKNINNGKQYLGQNESDLFNYLECTKNKINMALLDDFNTPVCIYALTDFIKIVNVYMKNEIISSIMLNSCSKYITKILNVFGLSFDILDNGHNNETKEQIIEPFVDLISDFRNTVKTSNAYGLMVNFDLITECDKLRDVLLPNLGIKLEDVGKGKTTWKFGDIKELQFEVKQREIKQKQEEDKIRLEKADSSDADESAEIIPTYSKFNDDGVPTHHENGEPLSKNLHKKLAKKMAKTK